jgi:hypothetical protein
MKPEPKPPYTSQSSDPSSRESESNRSALRETDRNVADSPQIGARKMASWKVRAIAAIAAVIPVSGLATARQLEPNSMGLGTHQQLGLPPCSMRLIFGIRCPGCGMTTSWAHFMQGEWLESLQTSVGGFLFAILALWIAFLAIRSLLTARLPTDRTQWQVAVTAAAIFAISLVQWLERLWV